MPGRISDQPIVLALIVGLLVGLPVRAQTDHMISVTGIRPVADALDQAEQCSGYVMTYEDPELVNPDDLRDFSIAVDLPVDANGHPDGEGFVKSVAAAGSGKTVTFRAMQSGPTTFHVVPTAQKDRSGVLLPFEPALSSVISLPSRARTGLELLEDLCAEVGRSRGRRVVLNYMGPPRDVRATITRRVSNEQARAVLMSFLASVDTQLTWRFLCQPEEVCVLNIHRIEPLTSTPVPNDVEKDAVSATPKRFPPSSILIRKQ